MKIDRRHNLDKSLIIVTSLPGTPRPPKKLAGKILEEVWDQGAMLVDNDVMTGWFSDGGAYSSPVSNSLTRSHGGIFGRLAY